MSFNIWGDSGVRNQYGMGMERPPYDNTQLGISMQNAWNKYTQPPTPGGGVGSSNDIIFNPITGRMEDKNGNPLKQVRSQGVQPGEYGGIDDGSGPTQWVSATGAPLAGGMWGFRGPSFNSGFRG